MDHSYSVRLDHAPVTTLPTLPALLGRDERAHSPSSPPTHTLPGACQPVTLAGGRPPAWGRPRGEGGEQPVCRGGRVINGHQLMAPVGIGAEMGRGGGGMARSPGQSGGIRSDPEGRQTGVMMCERWPGERGVPFITV